MSSNPFKGKEWEGWNVESDCLHKCLPDINRERVSLRYYPETETLSIEGPHDEGGFIAVKSPESARKIANIIAEELGGWE